MTSLDWGDGLAEMKKPPIDDPLNKLSVYKYILNAVWDDLCRNSGDCDCCTISNDIKLRLAKLCSDLEIRIKIE